jgi:hypothetical protein
MVAYAKTANRRAEKIHDCLECAITNSIFSPQHQAFHIHGSIKPSVLHAL